ncbi:MAG: hypothetical protein SGARI_001701 [Bacillariaceae sp.]
MEWAKSNGVAWPGKVEFRDGGVFSKGKDLHPDEEMPRATLITIPSDLILSSDMVPRYVFEKIKEEVPFTLWRLDHDEMLTKAFCLTLMELEEDAKGKESRWFPYLQALPQSFQSGIHWTKKERKYAKRLFLVRALREVRWEWKGCRHILKRVAPGRYANDRIKWAYSVVQARARIRSSADQAELSSLFDCPVEMACLGDTVDTALSTTVHISSAGGNGKVTRLLTKGYEAMVLFGNAEDGSELHMSFGNAGKPHILLVKNGFVDYSARTVPVTRYINISAKNGGRRMGFCDYEKMAFRCDTGRYTDDLYDAVIYAVAKSNIKKGDDFQEAVDVIERIRATLRKGEKPSKRDRELLLLIRKLFRKVVLEKLADAVTENLEFLGPVPEDEVDPKKHRCWNLLRDYHRFLLLTYNKALRFLEAELKAFEKLESHAAVHQASMLSFDWEQRKPKWKRRLDEMSVDFRDDREW